MSRNLTPWDIPLNARIKKIDELKEKNKSVAILIYPSPDASTFRYRGYNLFCASALSEKWGLVYFFFNELSTIPEIIKHNSCNLLILARVKPWSPELDELSLLAHKNHIPVLNDLDDCICGQVHIKEMFNSVAPDQIDIDYWINASAHFELVSQLCDGFIATNDYLGQLLSETHQQKPYYVIQNSLNQEQISYSEFLVQRKHNNPKPKDAPFVLGYFSGSATHAADFEVIYEELFQLLSKKNNIKLRIVGKMDLPSSATSLIKANKIEFYPIVDFLELQRLISEVDINLAPLQENAFTNCKSELKFFESAIVETPTIASPAYSFCQAIKPNETGLLCRPGEWTSAILNLYNDPELANRIARQASKACLEQYSPAATAKQLDGAFSTIVKNMV